LVSESEFQRDMSRLRSLIQAVKHQYDLFFAGGRKDPPAKEHAELEGIVRFYNNESLTRLSQQFLFSSLANKFMVHNEQWNKWMRARDEGLASDPRLLGSVRKARKALQDMERQTEQSQPEEGNGRPSVQEPRMDQTAPPPSRRGGNGLRKLYDDFLNAKLSAGQVPQWDFKAFEAHLKTQRKNISAKYPGRDVVFSVQSKDGRVTLKARVVK
jgi:hypothetical protein